MASVCKMFDATSGIKALAPPKRTANSSNESTPSKFLLLNTNENPFLMEVNIGSLSRLATGGFGYNCKTKIPAVKIKAAVIKYELEMPMNAINNPPMAWPPIDDISQVDELYEMAFCNCSRDTMAAIILLAEGPAKERMIPVQKTTDNITISFVEFVN